MIEDLETMVVQGVMPYYRGIAKNLALRIGRPDYEEDLVQVAFLEIFRELRKYDPERSDNFPKACYRRVRGAMIDYLRGLRGKERNSKTFYTFLSFDMEGSVLKDTMGISTRQPGFEFLPRDWTAVLTERQEAVVKMLYWDGLNDRQAGKILGVSESRVCQIRISALKQLRPVLE